MTKHNNKNKHKSYSNPAAAPLETRTSYIANRHGGAQLKDAIHWLDKNRVMSGLTVLILATYIAGNIFSCNQLKLTEKSVRIDQRPWIKLTAETGNVQLEGPFGGRAHLTNFGKTPAKDIRIDFSIDEVPNGQEPKLDYPTPHYIGTTGIIYPNTTEDFDILMLESGHTDLTPHKISKPEFDLLAQQKMYLVIYGKVEYKDFFGISHWTRMCQFVAVPSQQQHVAFTAKPCTEYGNADSN